MSLGETPLILDACEMVTGLIFDNFCLASIDIDLMLDHGFRLKEKDNYEKDAYWTGARGHCSTCFC